MTALTNSILFEDDCLPTSLVDAINEVITSDKTALQMWSKCTALLVAAGVDWWETAPRDWLICILDARGTRGFDRLAKRFGYIPRGLDALEVDPE